MLKATIQNRVPRRDIHGEIMDVHDGCMEYFDGRYWLYGTRYGASGGYENTHTFVCYSSPDLNLWTPHGSIIPDAPPALYYRPYVKHCAATGKWVLWYYWTTGWRGSTKWRAGDGPLVPFRFAVSTSDQPQGPFQVANMDEPLTRKSKGDHNLFVDDDGTGYIVYTSPHDDFRLVVEKLTPDYLHGAGETSAPIYSEVEAPCMFRRSPYYYILCGATCCFCPKGAGAQVFRSTHPLGPYEPRFNINRIQDNSTPLIEHSNRVIIPGQETFVSTLHTVDGPAFIWMADLWESAPDGIKGHDLQYWSSPLSFDDHGDIIPLKFEMEWSILLGP
jgi:hypothetical protein